MKILFYDTKKYDKESFDKILPKYEDVEIEYRIFADNTNDEISGSASMTDVKHTETDARIVQSILDDITIYKGVKQEDINNKTVKFMCYASAVFHME